MFTLLSGKKEITLDEAIEWAQKEISKTHPCDDPAFTLPTFLGSDVPEEVMERPLREQLLLDREVLVRGVPCPQKELGKTIEAYWLAFTPWEKIVLCQIRITERGERILEVIEEGWDGNQIFHEETPLPLKDGNEPPPPHSIGSSFIGSNGQPFSSFNLITSCPLQHQPIKNLIHEITTLFSIYIMLLICKKLKALEGKPL